MQEKRIVWFLCMVGCKAKNVEAIFSFNGILSLFFFSLSVSINRFHFIFSSNEKAYLTFTFIAIGVHNRVSPSKK
jgi:hypothetical protein